MHNAKLAYYKKVDPNVYVKFANETDLMEAYKSTFYYGNMTINGLLKNIPWSNKILWRQTIKQVDLSSQKSLQIVLLAATGLNLTPITLRVNQQVIKE